MNVVSGAGPAGVSRLLFLYFHSSFDLTLYVHHVLFLRLARDIKSNFEPVLRDYNDNGTNKTIYGLRCVFSTVIKMWNAT